MRLVNLLLLLALMLGQGRLWFGDGGAGDLRGLRTRVVEQQKENAELLSRNKALAMEVRDLKGGFDAIEEHARSELGLVGHNEEFFQIVDATALVDIR